MAFVRWRGYSAQLLASVYDHGRTRQVLLANLGGAYYVHEGIQAQVAQEYPQIRVDWEAVNRALAQGPPVAPAVPPEHLDWGMVEHYLRDWARLARFGSEAYCLQRAADVLTSWRAQKPYKTDPEKAQTRHDQSSSADKPCEIR